MNITVHNWKKVSPLLADCAEKAAFVALDFEMSGLWADPELKHYNTDTLAQRYTKARRNIMQFAPLQLGLCFFIKDGMSNFIAHPFNINCLPSREYVADPGALTFLTKHNFDFNMLMYSALGGPKDSERANCPIGRNKAAVALSTIVKAVHQGKTEVEIDIAKMGLFWIAWLEQCLDQVFPGRVAKLVMPEDNEPKSTTAIVKFSMSSTKTNPIPTYNPPPPISTLLQSLCKKRRPLVTHNGFLDMMHVSKMLNLVPSQLLRRAASFSACLYTVIKHIVSIDLRHKAYG